MRSFAGGIVAASVLAAWGAAVAQEPKQPVVRAGLEALEARLDRAVDSVSLPHAARLIGRGESARAYRLPGYGIVLVLTPRALPGPAGRVYFVQRSSGPKARKYRVETTTPGAPTRVEVDVDDDVGVETFERQVLVLQHETEAARRAAEEEMERIVHDVRVRIAPPPPPGTPAPPAPGPPGPPAARGARAKDARRTGTRPRGLDGDGAERPRPPALEVLVRGGAAETRAPEVVIADVRASLVETLSAAAEVVTGLPGDERVTVAVDFVPGGHVRGEPAARPDPDRERARARRGGSGARLDQCRGDASARRDQRILEGGRCAAPPL